MSILSKKVDQLIVNITLENTSSLIKKLKIYQDSIMLMASAECLLKNHVTIYFANQANHEQKSDWRHLVQHMLSY